MILSLSEAVRWLLGVCEGRRENIRSLKSKFLVTLHLKIYLSRWKVSGAAEQKMIEGGEQ